MDKIGEPPLGSRQLNLKKSFKLGLCSMLTACSKEEFVKAFSMFTNAEQEGLYRLYIQVMTSLHENVQEEFESLCFETQVGTCLDTVEQLSEEQSLDILYTEKTSIGDTEKELSRAMKDEIQCLVGNLQTAEARNQLLRGQVEFLKLGKQDLSATADAVEMLRSWSLKYGHRQQH